MSRKKYVEQEPPPLSPLPDQPVTLSPFQQWAVIAFFILFVLFGIGHVVATSRLTSGSFIQAPDEAAHIGYVRALAVGHRLPLRNDPKYPTYEWHQPPMYYLLMTPFYDAGILAMRILTLFFGLIGVFLVYQTVRHFFPNDPSIAIFALAFTALLPMRQATTASVGNDALLEVFFTSIMSLIFLSLRKGFNTPRAVMIGVCLGLALLTKLTTLLLFPFLIVALYFLRCEGETWKSIGRGALLILVVAFVIASPFYVARYQETREIVPFRAFQQEFSGTSKATDWIGRPLQVSWWSGALEPGEKMTRMGYLMLLTDWSWRTFWAAWTPLRLASMGIPLFLSPTLYFVEIIFVIVALYGLARFHFAEAKNLKKAQTHAFYLCVILFGLVLFSFLGFTWTWFQAQGRYLYPAILPIAVFLSLGYLSAFPPKYRNIAMGVFIIFQFMFSLAFLITVFP